MLLCCMKTIKDVFLSFQHALKQLYHANEIEAITLLVIQEITDTSRAKIKAFPEAEVAPDAVEKLSAVLADLKTGKPAQYILGSTEFYGLTFLVNPSVLIPRPETEELVQWVLLSVKPETQSKQPSILDIGTGSGCIAISLKKNLPTASVMGIDISADALHTAKQNAAINDVEVRFIEADILNPAPGVAASKFSVIISNPPYVTLEDKTRMQANVTDFEPHTALFVPEDDPLIFYKAIAGFASRQLVAGGLLFFEINESYGKETVDLLADKGFADIELRKDMSGRDRMVKATRQM
jgi:release factor glutamine methyltransferase